SSSSSRSSSSSSPSSSSSSSSASSSGALAACSSSGRTLSHQGACSSGPGMAGNSSLPPNISVSSRKRYDGYGETSVLLPLAFEIQSSGPGHSRPGRKYRQSTFLIYPVNRNFGKLLRPRHPVSFPPFPRPGCAGHCSSYLLD